MLVSYPYFWIQQTFFHYKWDRKPDFVIITAVILAFSALMLLAGWQERHPATKKLTGIVICLQLGADLHMAQLMPLPLTVSCFSEIHIGFTFLVLAIWGSPGKKGR